MVTKKAPATKKVAAKTPSKKPARGATPPSTVDDDKGGKGGPAGIFSNKTRSR